MWGFFSAWILNKEMEKETLVSGKEDLHSGAVDQHQGH